MIRPDEPNGPWYTLWLTRSAYRRDRQARDHSAMGGPERDEAGVGAAQHGHRSGRRAIRTGQQAQRYRQRQDISVRGHGLDPCRLAAVRQVPAAHRGAEAGGVTRAECLRDNQGERLPDGLLSTDPQQPLSCAVPGRDISVAVSGDDRVPGCRRRRR